MTMNNKNRNKRTAFSRRRIRIVEICSVLVCLLFVTFFSGKYLISPLFSASKQATKNTITYDAISSYVVEGDILDRNGNTIMGNATSGSGSYASYPENESYAYLLGYYSVNSGKENTYGLRGNLKDYSLFHLDSNNKGATVKLTTINRLQDYAYELLNGQEGSITVIDNSTGSILALASHSTITYDVNDVNSLLLSDVEGSQYRRGTYENDPPGSTFKIITAAAALEKQQDEGLDDSFFDYYDTGTYLPAGSDWTITNYESAAYGQVDLETAMNKSINCYFADLGVRIGADQLSKTAKAFMLGTDIEIPFLTTLHSSFDVDSSNNDAVAQTAFGQGNTEITPVHLALIAQAVANDGVMMSPYVVSGIYDGNNLPLYKHRDKKLSDALDSSICDKLKTILHSTAEGYGLDEYTYGMVYAKTGTAECSNGRIHTYIVGFTENASFCISLNNSDHSYNLYPLAQQLVSQINEIYIDGTMVSQ